MKKAYFLLMMVAMFSCSTVVEQDSDHDVRVDSTTMNDKEEVVYHGTIVLLAPQENPVAFTQSGLLNVIQQTKNQLESERTNYNNATATYNNVSVTEDMRARADSVSKVASANVEVLATNLKILDKFLNEINNPEK